MTTFYTVTYTTAAGTNQTRVLNGYQLAQPLRLLAALSRGQIHGVTAHKIGA